MWSRQHQSRVRGQGGSLRRLSLTPLLLALGLSVAVAEPPATSAPDRVLEPANIDQGAQLVQAHCSACHSLALVTQNRMSREGWIATIRWMQDKQGLWDLGQAEAMIVEYLAEHFGVTEPRWRRKPLAPPPDKETPGTG
jgi:hypothetical protein